ncbi:MAG: hypothetical protein JXQ29_06245 [Planctomycetes bacterium]|nr:hypothetical protein [Planctomycetota bacterium]
MWPPGRRVFVVLPEGRNAPRLGFLRAFWIWFRRDFVLRRLALVVSGLCVLFILGYLLLHVILLAPALLLAVICFLYGMSGSRRAEP